MMYAHIFNDNHLLHYQCYNIMIVSIFYLIILFPRDITSDFNDNNLYYGGLLVH